MSYKAGIYEYRIMKLGWIKLFGHTLHKSFEEFIKTPHHIICLEQECIERFKKKYGSLYSFELSQSSFLYLGRLFDDYYEEKISVMKMLVDLPEKVIKRIIQDEERQNRGR